MIDSREYIAAETLKDGLAVTIRALRPDDRERIAQALRGLDRESIYYRLFGYRKELTEAGLDRIMSFEPQQEIVLLATVSESGDETVIGSGRYAVTRPGTAEIAFVVEEDYHGRGLASRLLRHLATVARGKGVTTFEAEVLAGNKPMQAVFERTGWPSRKRRDGDAVHVTMTLPGGSD